MNVTSHRDKLLDDDPEDMDDHNTETEEIFMDDVDLIDSLKYFTVEENLREKLVSE